MSKKIEIAGEAVKPGTRVILDLPIPQLYTHTPMQMPVHVEVVRQFDTDLPRSGAIWLLVLWAAGTLPGFWRLFRARRMTRRAVAALPVVNEDGGRKVAGRIAHWQQRLSLDGDHVAVAGTCAQPPHVDGCGPYEQAVSALAIITAALEEAGAVMIANAETACS